MDNTIRLDPEKSPFYEANKNYCDKVEAQLKLNRAEYTGYCSSFGYEIEAGFKRNILEYNVIFTKSQATRRDSNAVNYTGFELKIKGLGISSSLDFGRNSLKRIFSTSPFKTLFHSPYHLLTNVSLDEIINSGLSKMLSEYHIDYFVLKGGKLKLKIHDSFVDVFTVISKIEPVLLKWD